MIPCIVIPTFWTGRRGRFTDRLINVYDHPTPVDKDGPLPQCLDSLTRVRGLGTALLIVAGTDPAVEHQAEDRVRDILGDFPELDVKVIGPAEIGSLHRRLEQLEFADLVEGATLSGYGGVRNVGLMVAATLGCDRLVFVDDDQVVTDPDFLGRAAEGLGESAEDGTPLLAKTGFYTDEAGAYQVHEEPHWADMFWRQSDALNAALKIVDAPPRFRRSGFAFGGCMALHRDMYCNVSFDPWIVRGEDSDYVVNARMHGGDVFMDGEWSVVHKPPGSPDPAVLFRQDVYRYIYAHRKLEFAKSQVDLRQVSPESLGTYPGEFVDSSVVWRAAITAVMRAVSRGHSGSYLKVLKAAFSDANTYARENCDKYFAFQRRWPMAMDRLWEDVALKSLFTGERSVDRSAITGRFPVIQGE